MEELLLAHRCLVPMKTRLDVLLEEWPDNPILSQLKEICIRLLSMPVTSAVKKMLTGMELLLAKSQIWEDTAASYVSLTAELKQISGLVVRWQRMQLESWKASLERVASRHAEGAHKTWFYISRILSSADAALKVTLYCYDAKKLILCCLSEGGCHLSFGGVFDDINSRRVQRTSLDIEGV